MQWKLPNLWLKRCHDDHGHGRHHKARQHPPPPFGVRQREHQEVGREALIAAMREACQRLGYTVSLEPQENPNRPRQVHVDTGAYGIITFELSLDAVLRTECPIVQPRICENWVEDFEEEMAQLGVSLQFRYHSTGEPVRQGKTARGLGAPRQASQTARMER